MGSLHQALVSGVMVQWLIDPEHAPTALPKEGTGPIRLAVLRPGPLHLDASALNSDWRSAALFGRRARLVRAMPTRLATCGPHWTGLGMRSIPSTRKPAPMADSGTPATQSCWWPWRLSAAACRW